MNTLNNKSIFVRTAVIVLVILGLTCSCNLKLPVTKIETGPTQTADLQVPMPDGASSAALNLKFLAGDLKLSPGADGYLASGTATYNAPTFAPVMTHEGNMYTLSTGDQEIEGFPKFEEALQNEWDLQLASIPLSLSIDAAAYTGNFELGGLALERLAINEGGSNFTGAFSTPNQIEMSSFSFNTGGSTMKLTGLANANFAEMKFEAGAGDYTLSFDGELKRDATIVIDAGVGTVNLIVPEGVNARVSYEGGLSSVNAEGEWAKNGAVYTLTGSSGSSPSLNITVKMGMGTLNLKTE